MYTFAAFRNFVYSFWVYVFIDHCDKQSESLYAESQSYADADVYNFGILLSSTP